MQLVTNDKYRPSKNGGATQVILHCHGGWSTADGKLFVPAGMVVNFYSAHGQFGTRSQSIAETLLGAQDSTPLDPHVIQQLFQQKEQEGWSNSDLDKAILRAKGEANSQGMGPSMELCEAVRGRGLGNRQKVYNYTLSYKGPRDDEQALESLFLQHQQGTLSGTIDLLIMQKNATGHLKSAISFARSKGQKYTLFHFLPFRWVDAKDAKSMRTVNLPKDFGGEEFIETSVL
jgi:hypothetical protein